jgi:hypothetical protein
MTECSLVDDYQPYGATYRLECVLKVTGCTVGLRCRRKEQYSPREGTVAYFVEQNVKRRQVEVC